MSSDVELVLIFGALHLVALGCGAVLLVLFLRSEPTREHDRRDDEDGGGGGGTTRGPAGPGPRRPPGGGVPLPDARQASLRLRDGHRRLADEAQRRQRRPAREPARRPAEPVRR